MSVKYTDELDGISPEMLSGFFQGWLNAPTPNHHLDILKSSFKVWLAIDKDRCIGFINAISDGIFSAFIPLLEVLPEYKGKGIGSELVRKMETSLTEQYSLDIVCDANVVPFYERLGFKKCAGMCKRNFKNCRGNS